MLITQNIARNRKTSFQYALGILQWRIQQITEVHMLIHRMIALSFPSCNRFTMKNDNVEKRIQQKDCVRSHTSSIKQHRLRNSYEKQRQGAVIIGT